MKAKRCLILLLLLFISGCVEKIEDPSQVSQIYPWALAIDSPKDTVTYLYAQRFAEEVDMLSNGRMKIKVYDNGTLGTDRELLESCRGNDIPFVLQNTAPQVAFMPELAIFDLPVAYTAIEDVRNMIDDEEFHGMIQEVYQKAGYHLLGLGDQGFRVMTTNKRIQRISDFYGQKIRTMENANHIAFWKAIGANPTPMTFSEVYIGLQQGTIDAQENPYEVIVSGKIYEQQDYVVETNHLPHLLSLIVNDAFYASLTLDEQRIIDQAAQNAKQYAREQADERVRNRIEIITYSGTKQIKLDEKLMDQIKEMCSLVYEMIKEQAGEKLYQAYTKYMK